MTKPIQRHRLKCGPKPKVDMAVALPVLAESKSIKAAARVLGINQKTLQRVVDAEYWCPRCERPGERQPRKTICVSCHELEAASKRKRKCGACKEKPSAEGKASCQDCIDKKALARESEGWTNASQSIKKHDENLSEPFPAKHKLGNSSDWLSRRCMGVRV